MDLGSIPYRSGTPVRQKQRRQQKNLRADVLPHSKAPFTSCSSRERGLGFPDLWHPWCQAALKRNSHAQSSRSDYGISTKHGIQLLPEAQAGTAFRQRYPHGAENSKSTMSKPFFSEPDTTGDDKNIVEYLGIAADEPKRHGQLNSKKRAPLVEFGIEEDLCGLYCQYENILSPSYDTSCRDGCWFCHNQGVKQLRLLRKNYPDLWSLLMKWDLDSPVTFKADGHTVHDFDRRFQAEDDCLIYPDDRIFRWTMLDEELNYRWF